jgi:cytochrome P450
MYQFYSCQAYEENIHMVVKVQTPATHAIPLVREAPFIGSLRAHKKNRLIFYKRVVEKYGNVCSFHLGSLPIILFNTPEHAHSILVEHANDFSKGQITRKTDSPFIGTTGIFLSEGDRHRRKRKLLAPSFQPRHISSYADTIVRYGEQLVQSWDDGTELEIYKQMTSLTMNVVGKVLFGSDNFNENDALGPNMIIALEYAAYLRSTPFAIPFSWPTPRNRRARTAIQTVINRLQGMVDERRASTQEGDDLLSVLVHTKDEDGNLMSNLEVMHEYQNLFGASFETTATALTWTWYLLTTHPAIYQKVRAEVDSLGHTPTYADFPNLPYCLQVFKEAMRLYPPSYTLLRQALCDVEIGNYLVPEGYFTLIPVYMLHRNPDAFPDPEQFNPDRFTPEREQDLPRGAYMPFGAGPRICMGNHLVLMEGPLLLATLAQRVTFELLPGQTIEPDVSKSIALRPNRDVIVKMKKR